MVPICNLAREAADAFTTTTRAGEDDTIVVLRDDRPDWVQDLTREAHGDMFPDDWRYECIRAALEHIAETDAETIGDLDDEAHAFADAHVDVYTAALTRWLASHLERVGYVDEAVAELGGGEQLSEDRRLQLGQYQECYEVFSSVVASLEAEQEAREEAAAEEESR